MRPNCHLSDLYIFILFGLRLSMTIIPPFIASSKKLLLFVILILQFQEYVAINFQVKNTPASEVPERDAKALEYFRFYNLWDNFVME